MKSSLLIEKPKTYEFWWYCVPVLPAGRDDPAYEVLKRQWCDHTMNCVGPDGAGWKLRSSRGFYVQDREDHVTIALFHVWAALPVQAWAGPLLDLWSIPHGRVEDANWSYSWEEKPAQGSRPLVADIVLSWRDEHGDGVLVIEAKRAGGKLSAKDTTGGTAYLSLPRIGKFARRHVAFLVAGQDVDAARRQLPAGTAITTWEAVGQLQVTCCRHGLSNADLAEVAAGYVRKHYRDLGFDLGEYEKDAIGDGRFSGTVDRYDLYSGLGIPAGMQRFLVGSEVVFCARAGNAPAPPYEWLRDEPSFPDVSRDRRQATRDRERPLWLLPQQ